MIYKNTINAHGAPIFSFLNQADTARGQLAMPQYLNVKGRWAEGKVWLARDYDSVAGTWPEHFGDAAGLLTEAGSAGNVKAASTTAGGIGDVRLEGNSNWHFNSAENGIGDIGAGNDFVLFFMSHIANSADYICDTRDASATTSGLVWARQAGVPYMQCYFGDGSSVVNYSWGSAAASFLSGCVFCDRDHATGLQGYRSLMSFAKGNPTGVTGQIGSGAGMHIMEAYTGIGDLSGNLEIWAMYQADGGWLDASDTTVWDAVYADLLAQVTGRQFTVYRGTQSYPDLNLETARTYTIDGTTPSVQGGGLHPLESDDSVIPHLGFVGTSSEAFTIPNDNIPANGEWTVEFWLKQNGTPASQQYIMNISDGTSAENFEIGFNTSGYLTAICESASGDNGSVTGSDNLCDNAWHKISVAAKANLLSVEVDDVNIGTDTSSTMPTSPDTFIIGANYNKSSFSTFKLRAGEDYGFHVYETFRH